MRHVILIILLVLLLGCTRLDDKVSNPSAQKLSSTQDLTLDRQDMEELDMISYPDNQDLQQIGVTFDDGTACNTEEYETNEHSSLAEYSICSYILDDTEIIIELKKFTDKNDLNGSYQYDSSHYYSAEGMISENTFGDLSRFRVNNEHDYGGTNTSMYYYHLWITKDDFLIHITSKGTVEAQDTIADIGEKIVGKLG